MLGEMIGRKAGEKYFQIKKRNYFIIALFIIMFVVLLWSNNIRPTGLSVYYGKIEDPYIQCSQNAISYHSGINIDFPLYYNAQLEAIGPNIAVCTTTDTIDKVAIFYDKELSRTGFIITDKRVVEFNNVIGEIIYEVEKDRKSVITLSSSLFKDKTSINIPLT